MIGNLQLLRAFAASGVVIIHTHMLINGLQTQFFGISIFFVISGYLMCKINNRTAFEFARDRVLRIVPTYWLATILLLALFKMWTYWPIDHTLLSFLFIPHDSVAGLYPVLGVGWTLNVEMYFYTLFTLFILINQRLAPVLTGISIMCVAYALPHLTTNKVALFYYASKDIKFFTIGICLWYLTEWLKLKQFNFKLPASTFPIALIIFVIDVLFFQGDWMAVSLLCCICLLAAHYSADLKPKLFILMGDASYACYLLHIILIEYLRHHGIETSGSFIFTTSVMITSWVIAIAWYLTIEKYLTNTLNRMFKKLPSATIFTGASDFPHIKIPD